jgi:hypothetical protein
VLCSASLNIAGFTLSLPVGKDTKINPNYKINFHLFSRARVFSNKAGLFSNKGALLRNKRWLLWKGG